jgi:hypothetical protein
MKPFESRQTATTLDFLALSETGRLERCKVRLTAIIGFGIVHEPVMTRHATFTRWRTTGYLLTRQRRYRVSVRVVRSWQRAWRWQLRSKELRVALRRDGQGSAHRAVDWHYLVLGYVRRGSLWPRRQRPTQVASGSVRVVEDKNSIVGNEK